MKKSIRKNVSRILVAALLIGCAGTISPSVSEAKIKLSKKKLNMKVGDVKYLYVKGTAKKVKWSSSNSKVAKVKYGTVTAKKAGSCTIKAKVGKKKLTCVVIVKAKKKNVYTVQQTQADVIKNTSTAAPVQTVSTAPPAVDPNNTNGSNTNSISNSELAANITVNAQPLPRSENVLLTIKNNNKVMVNSYEISYQLVSSEGSVVDSGTKYGDDIMPGMTQYSIIGIDSYEKTNKIDVTKSTLSVNVDYYYDWSNYRTYYDASGSVDVTVQKSDSKAEINLTLKNNCSYNVVGGGVALFLDSSDKILAASVFGTSLDLDALQTKFTSVSVPHELDANGGYVLDEDDNYIYLNYSKIRIEKYASYYVSNSSN